MPSFDWKSLVRTVAPTVATALGGPLAGMATTAVSNALLGKPDGTEAEIAQAASGATHEQIAGLKKAEQEFALKLRELGIKESQLSQEDRKDARAREIAALTIDKDHTTRNLAYIVLFAFLVLLGFQFYVGVSPTLVIDEGAQRTLDITTGILFAWTLAVKDYYFGSSQGAVASNKSLRKIAESE